MFFILGKIVLLSLLLSLLSLGFVKHFIWRHETACAMTYMYQNPEYIPIELDDDTQLKFPTYKLWLYGEGDYAKELKSKKTFDGIPVLFIPGTAASYKQVRSLASVSLTKTANRRSPIHFNYFALDFSEEFSAFYGGCQQKETEFVAACVQHILTLYSSATTPPKSVILVGHSMGGVIAISLLTLPHFDSSTIEVIYTLGSPHTKAVAFADYDTLKFYQRTKLLSEERVKHVNVVSIGGGVADQMVRSDFVEIPINTTRNLVVQSTRIPHVWAPADHLCLLWCNQLVLTIVRSMFQLVNDNSRQLLSDTEERERILKDHFVRGLAKSQRLPTGSTVLAEDDWKTVSDKAVYFKGRNSKISHALLLPVLPHHDIFLTTKNMDLDNWVYACLALEIENFVYKCELAKNFSDDTVYLPSFQAPLTKVVHIARYSFPLLNHLVILLPPNRKDIEMYADHFKLAERNWTVSLDPFRPETIVFPAAATYAKIVLHKFDSPWLAYKATVTPSGDHCRAHSHFVVPWSEEDTFSVILKQSTVHILRLVVHQRNFTPIKNYPGKAPPEKISPTLFLYLDPKCNYQVEFQFSLLDTVEQIVRRHWLQIPIMLAACLFQTLGHQFYYLSKKSPCSSPWRTLTFRRIFRNIVVIQTLASIYQWAAKQLPSNSLMPTLSWMYSEDWLESTLVISFLYLSVAGFGMSFIGIVTLFMTLSGKITARFLSLVGFFKRMETKSGSINHNQVFPGISTTIAVAFCAICLYIAQCTCGAVVLFLIHLFVMLKVWWSFVQMFGCPSPSASSASKLNVSLSTLWMASFLACGPQFAFWLRHSRWELSLQPDPSFYPAIIVTVASVTYRPIVDKQHLWIYKWLSMIQNGLSLVVLLFELDFVYLIVWTVAIDIFIISLCSSLSRNLKDVVAVNKSSLDSLNRMVTK